MELLNPLSKTQSFAAAFSLACLCGALWTTPLVVAGTEAEEVGLGVPDQVVEQMEVIRRRALFEEANELIRKGDEQMSAGRYDQAMEAYAGVREMVPVAPVTGALHEAATRRYAQAAVAQAETLSDAGDLEGAKQLIQRVLGNDGLARDPGALAMRDKLNDPVRNNQALDATHVQNVERVVDLLRKADGAIALGRYDQADRWFADVLTIDPTNVSARRGMERVIKFKSEYLAANFDQQRAGLLNEVGRSWELSARDPESSVPEQMANASRQSLGVISVEDKVERIIIPQISMDQVTLNEAIDFLRVMSAQHDQLASDVDARGVNFNINLGPANSAEATRVGAMRFDLQLRNVPVLQAIKYITNITKTSYVIDDYSLTIRPAGSASDEMVARTYRVPPDFISSLSGEVTQQASDNPFDEPAQGGLLAVRLSVQELLKRKGVSFPGDAIASYSPGVNMLRVVNTPQNQDIISQIIDAVKSTEPIAVSVQVTMIKVQQNRLEELGFDWLLTPLNVGQGAFVAGGTVGNTSGRTAGDFTSTLPLPSDPSANINSGVLTNGLRSGSQVYTANTLDALIANPDRATQNVKVSPGLLSLTGVYTDGQAQMMMRGLNQSKGVDLMANPSVVTRSGQAAQVVLSREFIYPTEYDPPEVGGGITSLVTPANPTAFETREVGITLEVLPVADSQKNYIDITLNPSIVEFDGFVNFGSPISTTGDVYEYDESDDSFIYNQGSAAVEVSKNSILMPVFSTQRATTQLTIADGATIAFGGLMSESITTVEDKVPFLGDLPVLGRLFQNKGYQPLKMAVVFLVRVELMDPTGRSYRE